MKAGMKKTHRRQVLMAIAVGIGALGAFYFTTPLRATDSGLWGDLVGRFVYDGNHLQLSSLGKRLCPAEGQSLRRGIGNGRDL